MRNDHARSRPVRPPVAAVTAGDLLPAYLHERSPARRVVLVPVSACDRRAVVAARYAGLIPADDRRAVHVAVDAAGAARVGLEWMRAQPAGLPLSIVDDAGGVAATVATAVGAALASGAGEVVVLLGRLSMRGVRRRLLHDGTADAISRAVNQVPGALSVLLAVRVEP
jgi:hypothetical protein